MQSSTATTSYVPQQWDSATTTTGVYSQHQPAGSSSASELLDDWMNSLLATTTQARASSVQQQLQTLPPQPKEAPPPVPGTEDSSVDSILRAIPDLSPEEKLRMLEDQEKIMKSIEKKSTSSKSQPQQVQSDLELAQKLQSEEYAKQARAISKSRSNKKRQQKQLPEIV